MFSKLFKGPFVSAGCSFLQDGWVTIDPRTGDHLKWKPSRKQTLRWNAFESQWLVSKETREEFLTLARQYWAKVGRQSSGKAEWPQVT